MTTRTAISALIALSVTAPAPASSVWGIDDLDVFDGKWKLGKRHSLVTELQGQGDSPWPLLDSSGQVVKRFGGDALSVRYAFDLGKWFATANYGRIGDTMRAGTEFSKQIGARQSEVVVGRSWGGSGRSWWTNKTLKTTYQTRHLNDGQVLSDTHTTELGLAGAMQSQLQLQYRSGREFQGGQLFDFDRVSVNGRVKPRSDVEMGVRTDFGEKLDFGNTRLAEHERVDPYLNWQVNKRLDVHLSGSRVDLQTKDGQWILDANMLDARLTWQFDWRGSLSLAVQQQDIARNPDAYIQDVEAHTNELGRELVYAWKLTPQTELHFGYSDAYAKDAEMSALAEPQRNWFMRVGYSLGL